MGPGPIPQTRRRDTVAAPLGTGDGSGGSATLVAPHSSLWSAKERPDPHHTATGHGEASPVAPNTLSGRDNPLGRAKNRRVEISYRSHG